MLDLTPLSALEVREVVAEHVAPGEVVDERHRGGRSPARAGGRGPCTRPRRRGAREGAGDRSRRRSRSAAAPAADLAAATGRHRRRRRLPRRHHAARACTDPAECPWRGLAAYDVEDARWYAGRERLVAEVVARLPGSRLLALVGASGSGKSSLMRAGLLAALRARRPAGQRDVARRHPAPRAAPDDGAGPPGARPRRTATSADLLRHLVERGADDADDRVVLVVDQLEEVWTVCDDEAERGQFLDTLGRARHRPPVAVTVVRRRPRRLPRRARRPRRSCAPSSAAGTVLVGPLTPAEIRRAVERPAATARLTLDDGLADTIVSDAGRSPACSRCSRRRWPSCGNGGRTAPDLRRPTSAWAASAGRSPRWPRRRTPR